MTTNEVEHSSQKEVPARSFTRVLSLVVALEKIEKPDLKKLTTDTGIPERSIHAMLNRLHREYFMVVERVQGRRFGYYRITDWGALNKERVMQQADPSDQEETVDDEQAELDFQQI